jgi:hypothetical protein
MALTQDQSAALQRITGNVESGYQSMARAKTALSALIAAGKATCHEVRAYNLYTTAIYNFQKATLQTLRGAGQTDVPALPPLPVYVAWRGITGDKAINIDCAQAQMQGATPTPAGDFYVGANMVEFRVGTDTTDSVPIATISQLVNAAKKDPSAQAPPPGLGAVPLVTIIIIGLVVALTAVVAVALTYLYSDLKAREEETKQITIQAAQYERTLAARASCLEQCLDKGNSPDDCTKACAKTLPSFDPSYRPDNNWGLFATIGAVAVVGVLGVVGYKIWRNHSDDFDGADEDDFEDVEFNDAIGSHYAYRLLPNGVIDVSS